MIICEICFFKDFIYSSGKALSLLNLLHISIFNSILLRFKSQSVKLDNTEVNLQK